MTIFVNVEIIGRPILYTTTTTQRGWCIEAFVSILVQSQSQKTLPGGGVVQNILSQINIRSISQDPCTITTTTTATTATTTTTTNNDNDNNHDHKSDNA